MHRLAVALGAGVGYVKGAVEERLVLVVERAADVGDVDPVGRQSDPGRQ